MSWKNSDKINFPAEFPLPTNVDKFLAFLGCPSPVSSSRATRSFSDPHSASTGQTSRLVVLEKTVLLTRDRGCCGVAELWCEKEISNPLYLLGPLPPCLSIFDRIGLIAAIDAKPKPRGIIEDESLQQRSSIAQRAASFGQRTPWWVQRSLAFKWPRTIYADGFCAPAHFERLWTPTIDLQ
jgi:hypothetical protein